MLCGDEASTELLEMKSATCPGQRRPCLFNFVAVAALALRADSPLCYPTLCHEDTHSAHCKRVPNLAIQGRKGTPHESPHNSVCVTLTVARNSDSIPESPPPDRMLGKRYGVDKVMYSFQDKLGGKFAD